jgi:hypothetical protein
MKNYGMFKKLKVFLNYRRTIKNIEENLGRELNARVDNAYRIYTVVNVPVEVFEEPYNFRKSDIDKISEKYIKEYFSKLSDLLNKNGLIEMYNVYDIEKVDKYSYLTIVGFSLFRTDKLFTKILLRWIPISLLLSIIGTTIYFLFKTF